MVNEDVQSEEGKCLSEATCAGAVHMHTNAQNAVSSIRKVEDPCWRENERLVRTTSEIEIRARLRMNVRPPTTRHLPTRRWIPGRVVGLDDVVTACRGLGGLRCPVHIYGRGDVMATAPLVQTLKGTKSLEDEDEKSRGRAGLSRFWFTVHTVDNYILFRVRVRL